MMKDGWNRHPYLAEEITADYPVFDLNDFKSEDGYRIVRRSADDEAKDTFREIVEYYSMNRRLFSAFEGLKRLLQALKVDFMKFETFSELVSAARARIDGMQIPLNDKAELLFRLADARIAIFEELEGMNIERPLRLLSGKFRHFLLVI